MSMDCSYRNQPQAGNTISCPNTGAGGIEQFPVGMGYVPWQQWRQTYTLEQAIAQGTIFPELDLPFVMGGCGL